jgi:23S rRNA pseudouridine2605 synthase
MEEIRLQKYMADCGVASRRKCEEFILAGQVSINGKIVRELGVKVRPVDTVRYNGRIIKPKIKKVYIMMNKPTGYVTTVSDQFDRPTVMDLLEGVRERVYPVGRLDYDTAGLLILTNDGDLTNKLTHPSHQMAKTYMAEVMGEPTEAELDKLRKGVQLEDFITSPAKVKVVEIKEKTTLLEITIHEGHNRQVRKMCDAIEYPALRLRRTKIGKLELGDLPRGRWKYIQLSDII